MPSVLLPMPVYDRISYFFNGGSEVATVQDDLLPGLLRGRLRHRWGRALVLREAMMTPALGDSRQRRETVLQRPESPISATLPCKP